MSKYLQYIEDINAYGRHINCPITHYPGCKKPLKDCKYNHHKNCKDYLTPMNLKIRQSYIEGWNEHKKLGLLMSKLNFDKDIRK